MSVQVGASLGLALCPADGRTASELVQAADQRMYASKAERKAGAVPPGKRRHEPRGAFAQHTVRRSGDGRRACRR